MQKFGGVHNAATVTLIAVKMGVVPASSIATRLLESVPLSQPNASEI